ncbi:hypothetical protein [Thiocapsa sp. N5-Cardenillas]|uniref:hypothetical protein n=1 Tax=Thiocapsa sp. N5-Cardenillas TaxID=3137397 RepID=UPI0035B19B0D
MTITEALQIVFRVGDATPLTGPERRAFEEAMLTIKQATDRVPPEKENPPAQPKENPT